MNAPDKFLLPDVQSAADQRRVAIDRVGIRGLRHPLRVRTMSGDIQHTVARADMFVALPPEVKGTHMSRFIEVLQAHAEALDTANLEGLMAQMLQRLGARQGLIELRFPYFVRKRAPVSGVESLMDYEVCLRGEVGAGGGFVATLEVQVPVTSLCPCSKEISDYGAHNQRSHITIEAQLRGPLGVEELLSIAEEEASCQLWGLLKRPDEKYVTERAYDNPKFVEDLVRDVALRLEAEPSVSAYVVQSENFESIHNHSAYARIARQKSLV